MLCPSSLKELYAHLQADVYTKISVATGIEACGREGELVREMALKAGGNV